MSNLIERLKENRGDAVAECQRLLDGAKAEDRDLTDPERRIFDDHEETVRIISERLEDLADREAAAARSAKVFSNAGLSGLNTGDPEREYRGGDVTREAVRRVEGMRMASDDAKQSIVTLIEEDDDTPNSPMARWAYVTSAEDYRTAFGKILRDPERGHMAFTPDETRAFNDARELQRAMSYGTNTAGGYLVPSFLDPAVYLTNSGANSPIPAISTQHTIATHTWTGVTSDGVTMSWDAEWTEVSDDSPTLSSVSIDTFKAAGFVAASFELTEDSDIAAQVPQLFTDARDRLEAAAFNSGNGTTAPQGIWTAIHADSAQRVVSTTAATIGLVDLQNVYTTLPVRWRPNSTWLMNPLAQTAIQNLGTAVSASFTTDASGLPDRLVTRPVMTDDYSPFLSTTTALDSRIILGDFSAYYIIRRVGMTLSYVPHLFGTTNGRPLGANGWYTHFRTGAKPVRTRHSWSSSTRPAPNRSRGYSDGRAFGVRPGGSCDLFAHPAWTLRGRDRGWNRSRAQHSRTCIPAKSRPGSCIRSSARSRTKPARKAHRSC
jgi:HK97 family phage major capsid protein